MLSEMKILLVEADYKNKYPPMGLMKLATYYRMVGDDVRFYKGDMRSLAVELICDDLINHLSIILPEIFWKNYYPTLFKFIKLGKYAILEADPIFEDEIVLDAVKEYRKKYGRCVLNIQDGGRNNASFNIPEEAHLKNIEGLKAYWSNPDNKEKILLRNKRIAESMKGNKNGKETQKSRFTGSLTTYQTKHHFKFNARMKYSCYCTQHK